MVSLNVKVPNIPKYKYYAPESDMYDARYIYQVQAGRFTKDDHNWSYNTALGVVEAFLNIPESEGLFRLPAIVEKPKPKKFYFSKKKRRQEELDHMFDAITEASHKVTVMTRDSIQEMIDRYHKYGEEFRANGINGLGVITKTGIFPAHIWYRMIKNEDVSQEPEYIEGLWENAYKLERYYTPDDIFKEIMNITPEMEALEFRNRILGLDQLEKAGLTYDFDTLYDVSTFPDKDWRAQQRDERLQASLQRLEEHKKNS